MDIIKAAIVSFLLASPASAQFGGFGGFGGNGNNGGNNGNNNNNGNGNGFFDFESFFSQKMKILTAHAALACVAFVILFPAGGIMIRLGTFHNLWLVHGLFQLFAYAAYIASVGLGIYMAKNLRMLTEPHAIIGLVLFGLLFFEPFLGYIHHAQFKRIGRRTIWSYGHLGLGRIIITLGIINGGLGLKLARDTGIGRPSNRQMVAYAVVSAICWVVYVSAAVLGEWRRSRVRRVERHQYKDEYVMGTNSDASSGWHGERYGNWRGSSQFS